MKFRTDTPSPAQMHKNLEVLMTSNVTRDVQLAIARLGFSGKAAVPGLCLLLKDPRKEVRRRAYRALEDLGDLAVAAIPTLISRMKKGDRWEQVRVAQLAQGIDPKCEAAVFALAEATNVEYRRRSARALPEIADPKAVRTLSTLLADGHAEVRRDSLKAAADMGERAAALAPQLADALTGPEATWLDVEDIPGAMLGGGSRLTGAEGALFEVGDAAVPALLERHRKGGKEMQLRVLRILGAMGQSKALRQAVRISMKSDDRTVRRISVACLAQVSVQDAKEFDALAALVITRPDEFEEEDLLAYVERVGTPFRILRRGLRHPNPRLRRICLSVAGTLPTPSGPAEWQSWTLTMLEGARDKDESVAREVPKTLIKQLAKPTAGTVTAVIPVAVALQRRGFSLTKLIAVVDRLRAEDEETELGRQATKLAQLLRQ